MSDKITSYFMIVLEGNVTVGTGKRKKLKPTIIRELYFVEGDQEIAVVPADLLVYAEQQMAQRHDGNKFVAVNSFRVLVNESQLREVTDDGEEE